MVPLEPASRRAFWAGLWIGVALRYFIFGALIAFMLSASTFQFCEIAGFIIWTPLIVGALLSPVVIPFVAGFATSYFWRRITWRDKTKDLSNAIWLSASLFLPFHLLFVGSCLLLTIPVDYALCDSGVKRGTQFWNDRQFRQFLGDFSMREEDKDEL